MRIWLLLVLLIGDAAVAEINVDVNTTWISPFAPEIHVLVTNSSVEAKRFSVGFVKELDGAQDCSANFKELDANYDRRYRRGAAMQAANSVGIVEANSWSHRSYALGAIGSVGPCRVKVLVHWEEESVERIVHVGKWGQYDPLYFDGSNEQFELSTIVEGIADSNRAFVRTYVRNDSNKSAHIMVVNRKLHCQSQSTLRWSLVSGSMQGMNSGPITLVPGGWIVFVDIVENKTTLSAVSEEDCRGEIEIGGYDKNYHATSILVSTFATKGSRRNAYSRLSGF